MLIKKIDNINSIFLAQLSMLDHFSKCVYSNIDKTHYYPILKLIFVMHNFINNNIEETKLLKY